MATIQGAQWTREISLICLKCFFVEIFGLFSQQVEYKKQYNSELEDAHRRIIFCKNLRLIDAHNERYKRGEVTFEMGVNQFADMSHEEFLRWLHTGSRDYNSIISSL